MRPLIIAHRGASHLAPENTLTAFRLAKTLGADGFECDVQITRDRHLVVAHDYLTDLKTGVHGNIPDMDFDDLRQLDFGKWKSPEFAGEKIPTLEEVLEVAQDFRMIHIELKPYFDRDEEIVDRVIDAVLDAGLEEKAVLTSFEYGTLRRVKERMPQMATCAMTLSPESQLSQPATSGRSWASRRPTLSWRSFPAPRPSAKRPLCWKIPAVWTKRTASSSIT